ncbi:MAG: GDSL-type esterase/lipase family protein, partial [Gemmatimonadota bacterium]|nr:GDSL-type esterase/lipase family protein [Gemmatimonadota bacterium]
MTLRFAASAAFFLLLSACSGGATPPVQPERTPTRLEITPPSMVLDDGVSERFTAVLRDQHGQAFATLPAGVEIAWSSSATSIASVVGGLVTGQHPGETQILAQAAGLRAEAGVQVRPVARRIEGAAGGGQQGTAGTPLPEPVVVRVVDRHGNGVGGIAVEWAVTAGGGSLSPASIPTDAEGFARATWTLGSVAGANTAQARASGLAGSPVEFGATATQPPWAVTGSATGVGTGSATLNGQVNPQGSATTARFEWGTGATLAGASSTAQQSVGAGTSAVAVSAAIGGLAAGTRYYYRVVGSSAAGQTAGEIRSFTTAAPAAAVRIVTFGDSNTDYGYRDRASSPEVSSYLSWRYEVRLGPDAPNSPLQLAGKIEARWQATRPEVGITAVNHGIGSTSSGTGRASTSSPNARTLVDGTTRFAAEVLGRGAPWHGGESDNQYFDGPITRVQAFTPGPGDFAYISIGTNDATFGISPATSIANLTWMVDQWTGAGLPASHLIMTTLAPRAGDRGTGFPEINEGIRELGRDRGIHVIDLAAHTSDDDGLTWRSST